MIFLAVVFCLFGVGFGENVLKPKIETPLGILEGSIRLTHNNTPFFAFEGVPYAEPPVGNLRFEEPEPIKPWTGVRATKNSTRCIQYSHFAQNEEKNYLVVGDEDCLFVNIYTHNPDTEANMDVLVHIHGGAFMFGSGHSWGPEIIMDRAVVYVNLNYRLGPLGFLSTEDNVIPGNNGLKDQTLALKWIKENIKYFGGNPDSITIWGLSAGGASVQLHYLMPQSRGLFNQGISQSGCVLNPWVLMENSREKANQVAHYIGCPTESSLEIKECLKQKPAEDIVQAVKLFQPWLYNPFSPFGVVVDSWANNPVLKDHPYNLLENKKVYDVPWIISYTSAEGLYPAAEFYRDDQYIEELNTKWNDIMPFLLHYNETADPSLKDKISLAIKHFYMGGQLVTRDNFSRFVQIISDRLFVADIETAARLHNAAVKSNVYSYLFDYRGPASLGNAMSGREDYIGVSHGDDTIYVASAEQANTQTTEEGQAMSNVFLDIFLSFMKTGEPNISEWKPVRKSKYYYQLKISGPQELVMEKKLEIGIRTFWDNIPFKENHHLKEENKDAHLKGVDKDEILRIANTVENLMKKAKNEENLKKSKEDKHLASKDEL